MERNVKKITGVCFTAVLSILMMSMPAFSDDKEGFDSEKIISEFEKQVELSQDKWEKLKPVLEEKSKELSKSMHESVDKGFAQLDELSKQFDTMSKDAELKVKEVLSSEEAQKLREYLAKVDEDAIKEAKDKMVADLNEILQLTEEQAKKIQPIIEESIADLTQMIEGLANESQRNWSEFKTELEKRTKDLQDKLRETLDGEQMEKLEEYNNEQKDRIKKAKFTV